jgi:hypothetical protein
VSAPARIGIIGANWRAQYYLRIAAALPDRFDVTHVLTRSSESAAAVSAAHRVTGTTDLHGFLAQSFDFVVIAVPRDVSGELIRRVVAAGTPVLAETPPAETLDEIDRLYSDLGPDAPVQIAEQYRFQPQHEARLAAADPTRIGPVTMARMSVAHGYHGISLLRTALGVGFDEAVIDARILPDRLLHARGRDNWETELTPVASPWTMGQISWAEGTGIYEFTGEQYFSPIRTRHVTVYGERGELVDDQVRYLVDVDHVAEGSLSRRMTGTDGDLEGMHLQRISLGETTLYRNVFAPARLSDDELAVASCLARMHRFVDDGVPFYGLADGCHDHYLALLLDESARTGAAVRTEQRPWSGQRSLAAEKSEILA